MAFIFRTDSRARLMRWFPSLPLIRCVSGDGGRAAVAPVEIRQVAGRRSLDQFVKMPWSIYTDDPCWVPPLLIEEKEFLNPKKHPFYLHGAAATFLAIRAGRTVGRILASDD